MPSSTLVLLVQFKKKKNLKNLIFNALLNNIDW